MAVFNIPQLMHSGAEAKTLRRRVAAAVALSLLLHCVFFTGWEKFRGIPLLAALARPAAVAEPPRPLQMVTVDEDLLSEELPPEEQVRLRGRVSRVSRDTAPAEKTLPVAGPSGKKEEILDAFKPGEVSPVDRGTPAPDGAPAPAPPAPEILETPPATPVPPLEKTADSPAETALETAAETPVEKSAEPETEKEVGKAAEPPLPQIPPETAAETARAETVAPVNPPALEKLEKNTEPAPEKAALPLPPPAAPAARPQPRRRPVPTRRIGARPSAPSNGGALANRSGRAAMQASFQSLAVLRDRYGEYMDKVLRRIQQAIFIQQQISPLMFNQGAVVMTFTISPAGRLEAIRFVAASPAGLVQETAAARQVLVDVQNGAPLPRPTPEMLEDPDFQKITINFIFAPQ